MKAMGKKRPPSQAKNKERNRQEVAFEAARIIATEGQKNFATAKQKAAQRLGVTNRNALPSNVEVHEALQEYQRLYGGQAHEDHLLHLRSLALEAMAFFKPFQPKLVGPVLDGTADQFSRICLHLFSDDVDAPIHHLMANDVPFYQERRRIRWHKETYKDIDIVVIEEAGESIEASIMVGADAKQPPPCPIDGQAMARASAEDVASLIRVAQFFNH